MRLSCATMLVGVPAGTTTAVHVLPSTSGVPGSAMDGISGNVGDRVLPVTARARSLLSLISCTAGAIAPNEIGVWPATVEPRVRRRRTGHARGKIQRVLKQCADELRRSAGARRGIAVFAGIGPDERD